MFATVFSLQNAVSTPFIKFQSSYVPEVSVTSYLQRIRRYSKCSDSCLILMLVYIDRAIESHGLILTSLNIHRLLIVSVMLAAKFHEDLFYNNTFYAQLGGLALSELNSLEVELLTQLEYSLHVDNTTYAKYSSYLQAFACQRMSPPPTVGSPYMQCSPRGVASSNAASTSPLGAVTTTSTGCDNAFQFSPFGAHKRVASANCIAAFSPQPLQMNAAMPYMASGAPMLPSIPVPVPMQRMQSMPANPMGSMAASVHSMHGGMIPLCPFPSHGPPPSNLSMGMPVASMAMAVAPMHMAMSVKAMPVYPPVQLCASLYGPCNMSHPYLTEDSRFLRSTASLPFEVVSVGY